MFGFLGRSIFATALLLSSALAASPLAAQTLDLAACQGSVLFHFTPGIVAGPTQQAIHEESIMTACVAPTMTAVPVKFHWDGNGQVSCLDSLSNTVTLGSSGTLYWSDDTTSTTTLTYNAATGIGELGQPLSTHLITSGRATGRHLTISVTGITPILLNHLACTTTVKYVTGTAEFVIGL